MHMITQQRYFMGIPAFLYLDPVICLNKGSTQPEFLLKTIKKPEKSDKCKKLVCFICQNMITDELERIDLLGRNEHCRTNPAGFKYNIECFGEAPGCAIYGSPTMEYSWFDGYHWQIAGCKLCGEHLGWMFKGADRFFGLIKGKIIFEQS
ncbi:MAG: hypothetical protein ACI9XC_000808 [Gammaproteobacteria bacterium]|jgi:hypothetical protein